MTTEIVNVTVEKTIGDALNAIADLMKGLIVDKKPSSEVLTAEVPALLALLSGLSQLGTEVQDPAIAETVALFTAKLYHIFVIKK